MKLINGSTELDISGCLGFKRYCRIQIQRIKLRTQILKSHPTAGQQIDFYANPSIRQLTEGNYNIIYKIIRVDILSVHHSARDLGSRNI